MRIALSERFQQDARQLPSEQKSRLLRDFRFAPMSEVPGVL